MSCGKFDDLLRCISMRLTTVPVDMDIDWEKCIVCQENTSEALKCPLLGPGTNDSKLEAYKSFLHNVEQFRAIDSLPTAIRFDNESADSFLVHRASWHKSCHLKYNNFKLQRAKKRGSCVDKSETRSSKRRAISFELCLFCEKGREEGDLHQILTFDADSNIYTMISELQDTYLLAKIDGGQGDLIAKEVKYHLKCLVYLRNRYRSHKTTVKQQNQNSNKKLDESIAFVELTSYIEKAVDSGILLFKLSELHSLYVNRLEDFGVSKSINKTRLKNDLLEHFPESQEQQEGKSTLIVFREGMKNMLKEALKKHDFNEDAWILAKAAVIVRKDIFNHEGFKFTGSFQQNCQERSVPSSLKSLISLIVNGLNLKDQDKRESQACLTTSQVILYNVKKQPSTKLDAKSRHVLQREPPLPIYTGLNVHQMTRSKKLINQLYQMGISISYNRVIELEEWIATSVCERFEEDSVVVPAILRKGLFNVGALDNIDHNPSSTTAVNAFHGCGMSLFQFPTKANPGESRCPAPKNTKQHSLPDSYAVVPAVALASNTVSVPKLENDDVCSIQSCLSEERSKEEMWLEHALELLTQENLTGVDDLVWAAYHASKQPSTEDPPAVCSLLPLFYEKAATPAMIKHGMDVQRLAIEHINPGQIPITTFDQPLFSPLQSWCNGNGQLFMVSRCTLSCLVACTSRWPFGILLEICWKILVGPQL